MGIIHDTIKSLRETRGLTQQQMADKLCITRSAYSKFESGTRKIDDIRRLDQIAKILGLSINDLVKSFRIRKQDEIKEGKTENEKLISLVFRKIDQLIFSGLNFHITKYEIPVPFEELTEYDLDYISICGVERTALTKEIYNESFLGGLMKIEGDGYYLAFKEMMSDHALYELSKIFFNSPFTQKHVFRDDWQRLQKEIESDIGWVVNGRKTIKKVGDNEEVYYDGIKHTY